MAVQVTHALRLGWYLAEVRGRLWWGGYRPSGQQLPSEPDHPLPLRPQRSQDESQRQALDALVYLSEQLDVTAPFSIGSAATLHRPFAPHLEQLISGLDADTTVSVTGPDESKAGTSDEQRSWRPIARLIYDWDSAIQDQLSARADILACAYLLGRGLSECYWALSSEAADPGGDGNTPPTDSWSFLLGDERRQELSRMVGRLGAYLNPLTPVAVAGSLEAWGRVAADPAWRAVPSAPDALYEQLRRWYQLLVLGQDPSTLVKPITLLHGKFTTLRLARAFWPQLLVGALSLGVVAAFVLLLTTDTGGPITTALLGLIGTVGVSASTLAAKAKNATQSLLTRLRQDAHSDLVAIEVTSVPLHPDDAGRPSTNERSTTHREIENAVAARTIAAPLEARR